MPEPVAEALNWPVKSSHVFTAAGCDVMTTSSLYTITTPSKSEHDAFTSVQRNV
jgi:hypothetical protein